MIRWSLVLISSIAASSVAHADPLDVFLGRSHGQGLLKVIFKSPQRVDVDNAGRTDANGDLILVQKVDDHTGPPRTRYWRIRKVAPNRYAGTMDDAVGGVAITINGDQAHLVYVDHDGNHFDQLLVSHGPREVINTMKVRRYGLVVARMTETIRKLD